MLTEGVIVAVVGAFGVVVGKILEKKTESGSKKISHEEIVNTGLRDDIARKEKEIVDLKAELRQAEELADEQRKRYWDLYEKYVEIKVLAKSILLKNGWTLEEIDNTMPIEAIQRELESPSNE